MEYHLPFRLLIPFNLTHAKANAYGEESSNAQGDVNIVGTKHMWSQCTSRVYSLCIVSIVGYCITLQWFRELNGSGQLQLKRMRPYSMYPRILPWTYLFGFLHNEYPRLLFGLWCSGIFQWQLVGPITSSPFYTKVPIQARLLLACAIISKMLGRSLTVVN